MLTCGELEARVPSSPWAPAPWAGWTEANRRALWQQGNIFSEGGELFPHDSSLSATGKGGPAPAPSPSPAPQPSIEVYYALGLSFYLQQTVQLLDPSIKHKDWAQVAIHHAVTVTLILLSFSLLWVRVGSLVFLLHDIPDVIMELAKIWNYMAKAGSSVAKPLTDSTFAVFAVSFLFLRVYCYSFLVWSSAVDAPSMLGLGRVLVSTRACRGLAWRAW